MNISELSNSVPVLLVDDRPENLLSLEELLAGQGYELVRALSGNEALRLMLKQDLPWCCWMCRCRRWTVLKPRN